MTDIVEQRAREFCEGAFGQFGVDVAPYTKIIVELIREVAKEQQAEIERLRLVQTRIAEIAAEERDRLHDEIERLRAARAEETKVYHDTQWQQLQEAQAEIERLRGENITMIETLKQPDQVGYWQRKYELSQTEIERLQAELQGLQFQPNPRKLTRDIIRSLILKVRTLELELKQAQVMRVGKKDDK